MPQVEVRKNWLLGQAAISYERAFEVTAVHRSLLVDGFLRSVLPLIPREAGCDSHLVDYKGRNPDDICIPDAPVAIGNELFRWWGEWGCESPGSEGAREPCEVVISTPFHAFSGAHHIIHAVAEHRSGALPAWLPTAMLGYAVPLRSRGMRFGIERFRSTFTFASIGYVPTAVDLFLVDVWETSGVVRFSHECKLRDSAVDPFSEDEVLAASVQVLERITLLPIREEYLSGVRG